MTITISDIDLAPVDGAAVSACLAVPATPRGGVVLLQEIFGVNEHIRSVAAQFAELGYGVVAPAMFDRVERGVSLGYTPADIERGKALRAGVSDADALGDIAVAITVAARFGRVAVIGYCWGGRLAWLAAARSAGLSAAVIYYPGGIGALVDEQPQVPALLHFGASDPTIPSTEVEALRARHPALPVHLYSAGHGFSCAARPGFDQPSHDLALDRTRGFLEAHVA
jgi:carboxymethylenebutenolidase